LTSLPIPFSSYVPHLPHTDRRSTAFTTPLQFGEQCGVQTHLPLPPSSSLSSVSNHTPHISLPNSFALNDPHMSFAEHRRNHQIPSPSVPVSFASHLPDCLLAFLVLRCNLTCTNACHCFLQKRQNRTSSARFLPCIPSLTPTTQTVLH